MTIIDFPSRSVESLVDEYVRTGKGRTSAISIFGAIRAIRSLLPECSCSDDDLTNIIAERAVMQGCAIFFDDVIRTTDMH